MPHTDERPSIRSIFWVFFVISAITIGGGYAMVPVICAAVVKRGWMSEPDFYTLFARMQSSPGPIALTAALAVGHAKRGPAGFAAAYAGIVLPPFFALILVGTILESIGDNAYVAAFLRGASAVIPGMVAALILKLAKNRAWNPLRAVATISAALCLLILPAWGIPLFFASIALSFLLEKRWTS